jgi:hypothetical protein
MLTRFVLGSLAAALAFVPLAGCGNSAAVYPVSGKVTYKGEPAAGAVVYFQRADSHPAAQEAVPFGIVQQDGAFSLSSEGLGNGAPPGSYNVLIEWRDPTENGVVPVKHDGKSNALKRTRIHAGPDRLKGKYFNVSKPLLKAEVKTGTNPLEPFELSD